MHKLTKIEPDFDQWFAKAVVQFYLAMAIQKERIEHTSISPKVVHGTHLLISLSKLNQCVIEQVEACYWQYPGQDEGNSINPSYTGSQLFSCIKSARSTKDEKTLQAFLDELNVKIVQSCRELRNEKVVELDAGIPLTPEHTHRAATPSYTATNEQSAEDSSKETSIPTTSDSSSLDEVEQSTTLSASDDLPLYRYTTAIYEHAALSGKEPEFKKEWISDDRWRCKGYYGGIHEVGEARSWKTARHVASQKLCKSLGISA